jgi:diguanylate cyclase (GGDEF)-like protein
MLRSITDFLSIKEIYSLQKDNLSAPEPEYDEKFGILLSPAQFLRRLALARIESRLRGTSISIAFIDIDNFKQFNKEYGEFIVDRSVLPIFMRSMEAHVHSHGFAFRFGGDEYMILFPNLSHLSAVESCGSYQQKLPSLHFPGVSRQLTVSIGLCTAGPDSPLTDREIQKLATDAKQVAKDAGKNRIAWIDGSALEKRQATIQQT